MTALSVVISLVKRHYNLALFLYLQLLLLLFSQFVPFCPFHLVFMTRFSYVNPSLAKLLHNPTDAKSVLGIMRYMSLGLINIHIPVSSLSQRWG